jgi:hypothetical protein
MDEEWTDSQDKALSKRWGLVSKPYRSISKPVERAVRGKHANRIDHGKYIEHIPTEAARTIDAGLGKFSDWIGDTFFGWLPTHKGEEA